MPRRTKDDFAHERQALDAAHAQNESGRDAFVALAHTALFAASVSFVGSIAPVHEAIWIPALILGWTSDVVGLLALTLSFGAARRAIDARRRALNDVDPPSNRLCEWLNAIALWSFPVSLLCLFSFVTANVVHANDRQAQPPADNCAGRSVPAAACARIPEKGGGPSPAGADARRTAETGKRSDSGSASTNSSPAATAAVEKVTTAH